MFKQRVQHGILTIAAENNISCLNYISSTKPFNKQLYIHIWEQHCKQIIQQVRKYKKKKINHRHKISRFLCSQSRVFLLQACRFTKRNENPIGNLSNLLRVYVIIEFGVLNLEMDYQYKNATGIRAQHVNDHKNLDNPPELA